MNYELAKELKDAGFPQDLVHGEYMTDEGHPPVPGANEGAVYLPTLEELIEACGGGFYTLSMNHAVLTSERNREPWKAASWSINERLEAIGQTPLEAVARLWLALRDKQK